MTDTRRSHVGPLAVFTDPNSHTATDRWFATVKIVIQQQIDGSLHFAKEKLSSANFYPMRALDAKVSNAP